MLDEILTASDRVRHILEKYPQARDSDTVLYIVYLNIFYGLKDRLGQIAYDSMKAIMLAAEPMESITRARRKVQEEGENQGTVRSERMEKARKIQEEYWKKVFPGGANARKA